MSLTATTNLQNRPNFYSTLHISGYASCFSTFWISMIGITDLFIWETTLGSYIKLLPLIWHSGQSEIYCLGKPQSILVIMSTQGVIDRYSFRCAIRLGVTPNEVLSGHTARTLTQRLRPFQDTIQHSGTSWVSKFR